jgi:hypothetical protein
MIKIDKKVPIPERRTRGHSYPFKDMRIGDSFIYKTINIGIVKNVIIMMGRNK